MPTLATPRLNLRAVRDRLGLSQSEFAALLGYSARTVQSCEQGWRQPSPALEKAALLLLLSHLNGPQLSEFHCWEAKRCPEDRRARCIAHLARQGHLCWFLTGTLCGGERLHDWPEKRELCFRCDFFRRMLQDASEIVGEGEAFVCPD
jgi:DNA-binding XRE family transcriptional regulator